LTHVCFICGNIYPLLSNRRDIPIVGGAEVQQYLMAAGLVRQGLQVSFVGEDFGQGRDTVAGGFRLLGYQLSANKALQAVTLWQAMRRADTDIYYVRGLPKFGVLIYLFVRWHRRRLVQALAGDVEVEPQTILGRANRLIFEINTLWRSRADLVIAQSRYQVDQLQARWGLTAELLPSLVPVPPAAAQPPEFSVLWVGGIGHHKRVERVGEAAARLPEVTFIVAGGPLRGQEAYYDQARAELSRQANVRWLGFVPYAEIGDLFQQASVLLHTSPQEGFPNVFLQAWAAGLPVVTLGVNPDGIVTARGLGLCFKEDELAEAAQAIEHLRLEPGRRREIGSRARAYVTATHHPDVVVPRYAALFRGLDANPAAGDDPRPANP
jgi:glycosyltransferase involved in cell wall biosynthesis